MTVSGRPEGTRLSEHRSPRRLESQLLDPCPLVLSCLEPCQGGREPRLAHPGRPGAPRHCQEGRRVHPAQNAP